MMEVLWADQSMGGYMPMNNSTLTWGFLMQLEYVLLSHLNEFILTQILK